MTVAAQAVERYPLHGRTPLAERCLLMCRTLEERRDYVAANLLMVVASRIDQLEKFEARILGFDGV